MLNLFKEFRDERFDAGSSIMYPAYIQSISDSGQTGMPTKLKRF